MKKIYPCLWFHKDIEAAAELYSRAFRDFRILGKSVYPQATSRIAGKQPGEIMTLDVEFGQQSFLLLNGGPHFDLNPALSFTINCTNAEEAKSKWATLSQGGKILMAFDRYPWSANYGWCQDRFGVSWQIIEADRPSKIIPSFLFANKIMGRGKEAIDFYTAMFSSGKIDELHYHPDSQLIAHAQFVLAKQDFILTESPIAHDFDFSTATSLCISCASQEEIDKYWNHLCQGGREEACGWLKDKFGFSWQIVPSLVEKLMRNPATAEKAMEALLKMKKPDLAKLEALQQ
jgi:predicted 3-demethylubiquinone-9 3-methyltransferase (glyoxalase superfamily)